ncbi:MAG: methyltransferase [Candidatus Korarchaeota archaeon]|nr:methyltransferase [Candidatus Korarchaeota archaeon]NIU83237.1 methyltransferase [Candidatus Thorarchaeota archaeon]NIW13183.1 methyltransferase [Candidatus Thorarchaeota archaeon]NIW51324.1 methyltransferase [Candidatus Korarchaeota archaeon]
MDYHGVEIKNCENVYPPSDDTFLLVESLRPYLREGISFLEIGVGTGLIAIFAAKKGVKVTGTDINPKAIACTRRNATLNHVSFHLKKSDLFTKVRGVYDVVAFNPPYLPAVEDDKFLSSHMKKALVGGSKGHELSVRFVREVGTYLKERGCAFLIASSRGEKPALVKNAKEEGFQVQEEGQKSFFFERIYALRLKKEKNETIAV